MKLNEELYAVVHSDGRIAGDGECSALHGLYPDEADLKWLRDYNDDLNLKVIKVKIVEVK